jgi:hypothetical protein
VTAILTTIAKEISHAIQVKADRQGLLEAVAETVTQVRISIARLSMSESSRPANTPPLFALSFLCQTRTIVSILLCSSWVPNTAQKLTSVAHVTMTVTKMMIAMATLFATSVKRARMLQAGNANILEMFTTR